MITGLFLAAGCGAWPEGAALPAGGAVTDPGDLAASGLCPGIPAEGRCDGSRLQRCVGDGEVQVTDCAVTGASCGWLDEATGQGCRAPAQGGSRVTGAVTYLARPVGPEGLGSPVPQPASGVTVQLRRASDDAVVSWGVSSPDGAFELIHDATEPVYVLAATVAGLEGYPLAVRDCPMGDCGRGHLYGLASEPFLPAPRSEVGTLEATEAEVAGAFHVFDRLLAGMNLAWAGFTAPPEPLTAQWRLGSDTPCGTSCFVAERATLYVQGLPEDEDQWDDAVLGHELGHYLEHGWSRSDNPGGAHDGSPADPRLAWSEGLSSFVATVLGGSPLYVDTFAAGHMVIDLSDTGYRAAPDAPLSQALSEFVVGEALWRLADGAAATDPAGATRRVFDVLEAWLPSPALADRGHPGVDLVDFLDGWLCRGHADVARVDAVVLDHAGFPYDYAGPPTCL